MSSTENIDPAQNATKAAPSAPLTSPNPTPAGGISVSELLAPITPESFRELLRHRVKFSVAQDWDANISSRNLHMALSLAVRDLMIERMLETERRYQKANGKKVYYLSMEFLVGRSLGNNLTNLSIFDIASDVVNELGHDLEELREVETDAALGNGGLGRLAACFLDSLATLHMPGFGYGINYEYGLFRQVIEHNQQKEKPDAWRPTMNPWLLERPDESVMIPLYGKVEERIDRHGTPRMTWVNPKYIVGVPSDMPIVGFGGRTVNYLRLYASRTSDEFDIQKFNEGNYIQAVEERIRSESISKVLYPSDAVEQGRELRLVQEYFFVACALRDIVRRYLKRNSGFENFPDQVAIQLNDTHPALTVAELMRVMVDENNVPWVKAWDITVRTLGYTNHTLLPEALEKWPVRMMENILPRHLHIIYQINKDFLEKVETRWPGDVQKQSSMSIIEEAHGYKDVRMAHLAIVGSHAVNGVAALHSDLVKSHLVPDFNEMWPEKFSDKTNGVTPRRWLLKANPGLSNLLCETIGVNWITDLSRLKELEPYATNEDFQKQFALIKRSNKERLAQVIKDTTGTIVDPNSMFDVIAKRIHEYKRQLLMALRIIHEYLEMVEDGKHPVHPRTYIFAGKAAPGYWAAKQVIRLINELMGIINNDKRVREKIKVVFIPDYRVSLAERIIPAADVSEQISTAGKEASGTGNMKFAMNGALTVGTMDGANIEISEEVGRENMFVFGLSSEEIIQMREDNQYSPTDYYRRSEEIRRVMDVFNTDSFWPQGADPYRWIFNSILHQGDPYFHLADFESYLAIQKQAGEEYRQPATWARKSILNVARIGKFSSDRTIREYADEIWNIKPV